MAVLRKATEATLRDYESIDRSYQITERLIPALGDGTWTFEPFDGGIKQEQPDEEEMAFVKRALTEEDADVFLAYDGSHCVGAIALRIWWNGCAYVEHIAVSPPYRGQGIAAQLMDAAVGWARERGRRVLMLEAQDVNARACRFYARQGFKLCGVDTMLYVCTESRGETALFWYRDIDITKGEFFHDGKD